MSDAKSLLSPVDDFLVSLSDFTMERRIGKGGYGEVWLATNNKTEAKCAIKKLFLDKLEGQNLQFFVREVTILATCRDLFLVPFVGYTDTPPYCIITEYIPKGSLFEALQHRPGSPRLSPSHKTLIAIGIAHGMMELHKHSVIHRDLKSLNILLDDRLLPKICDFGISRFVGENEQMTKEIGTPHWMAPEIFETEHYTEKVDVYAYGMMLWELVTEQVPFKGRTSVQVATAVCMNNERPIIPSSCPTTMKNLIQMCWQRDPEKRPSFKQIFHALSEKKTMFRETDPRSIAAILMLIKEDERRLEKEEEKRAKKKQKKEKEKEKEKPKEEYNEYEEDEEDNLPPPIQSHIPKMAERVNFKPVSSVPAPALKAPVYQKQFPAPTQIPIQGSSTVSVAGTQVQIPSFPLPGKSNSGDIRSIPPFVPFLPQQQQHGTA